MVVLDVAGERGLERLSNAAICWLVPRSMLLLKALLVVAAGALNIAVGALLGLVSQHLSISNDLLVFQMVNQQTVGERLLGLLFSGIGRLA